MRNENSANESTKDSNRCLMDELKVPLFKSQPFVVDLKKYHLFLDPSDPDCLKKELTNLRAKYTRVLQIFKSSKDLSKFYISHLHDQTFSPELNSEQRKLIREILDRHKDLVEKHIQQRASSPHLDKRKNETQRATSVEQTPAKRQKVDSVLPLTWVAPNRKYQTTVKDP